MADSRNPTAKKVLRTNQNVLHWTLLLVDLLLIVLLYGSLVLWQLRQYTGSFAAVFRLPHCILRFFEQPFQVALDVQQTSLDITEPFLFLSAILLVYLILQLLIQLIAEAIWRSRVQSHMQQLAQVAQEARRLGAEEVRRSFHTPRIDDLEEAIDQITPTNAQRLHLGDPDLQGLEEAVNDLLDRMQAAYSQQSRFVSDASHELRTPIAVLKGYADLLERWGKHDPQVRDEAIAAIQTEAGRMSRLVEQLLFLARGDSGRTQLQPVPLDLKELVEEVWEESRMIDADHTWLLDAPEAVPCTGDRDMLKQALRILSDNAIKYTPSGKQITLRACLNRENRPCLIVRDEGMGIKSEDAAHVFERFYRSDPARSRQSGGAGLGLAIAQWIVEQHKGHMEVYSWEGIGSRFTIVL